MKVLGIILAGGRSTRLFPATLAVSKQMLPIYDKPLIYYPFSMLMLGGVRDINIITNLPEQVTFEKLFKKSGFKKTMNLSFISQLVSNGIPEAFNLVSTEFGFTHLDNYDKVVLILGDNLYHGASLTGILKAALNQSNNACMFVTKTSDMTKFGVAEIDCDKILTLTEKPSRINNLATSFAITGMYVFPIDVFQITKHLKQSERGETEIIDLLRLYHKQNRLDAQILPRGVSWFDTGTPDGLLDAAHYVKTIQTNQGTMVGSPHEIALRNGWMTDSNIKEYLELDNNSDYSKKLLEMVNE